MAAVDPDGADGADGPDGANGADGAGGPRGPHAADLALARAAGAGDAAAVRELDAIIADVAGAAARRIDPAAAFADEVRQAVRIRLLVADRADGRSGAGRARIGDYAGRGPLRGWIRVAALRIALNLKRATGPASPDVLAELVSTENDPELRHLKQLYRAEFRAALEAALAALPERSRALLRLSYVDGMKLVQLGRLYDVHETTVARWVANAAADVAEDTRRRLVAKLALSPSSLESVARMVLSNLDFSIGRVLRG